MFVARILSSRAAAALVATVPVPLVLVRGVLLRDNAAENRRNNWARLRDETEAARYATVRAITERYAADGFVLDLGCSQGILQEGLRYRRYVGVDNHPPAIDRAQVKADETTAFIVGEAETYVPDERPDAVVLNEVIYYLRHPTRVIERHAAQLAPDGVIVVSVYDRPWAARWLLRRLSRRYATVENVTVTERHHSWTVTALRRLH
jgi:2-polyprenyl-3-methyl-5-hydroxy-6-metoxy-1,4-benzoquinol methylase